MLGSLEPSRKRLIGTLFAGNAVASVSFIGAITVAVLVAKALTGRDELSGLPAMLATFGAAGGAVAMTAFSRRAGRRPAFILGYALAGLGMSIALLAVMAGHFLAFLAAMVVVGFGRSVSQLSRYAAGDLVRSEHRGTAISLVVWAATIGAIIGPLLIKPSGDVLDALAGEALAGPYAVGTVGFLCAAIVIAVFLRPEPMSLTTPEDIVEPASDDDDDDDGPTTRASLASLVARPRVLFALSTLAVSQLVMVMVMAMTPVHIRDSGHGLGMVGWVMMAHTSGMFAIAPLTGILVDRIGSRRVIIGAMLVLAGSAAASATASHAEAAILLPSLLFLGVGWNFGFVAGSAALTEGLATADRLRLQGLADSLTWISGGTGALLAGVIVAASSYGFLGAIGASLTVLPMIPLWRLRREAR